MPPSPIEVKKLIEKRVFLGLSLGNRPSKYGPRNLFIRKILTYYTNKKDKYKQTIIK